MIRDKGYGCEGQSENHPETTLHWLGHRGDGDSVKETVSPFTLPKLAGISAKISGTPIPFTLTTRGGVSERHTNSTPPRTLHFFATRGDMFKCMKCVKSFRSPVLICLSLERSFTLGHLNLWEWGNYFFFNEDQGKLLWYSEYFFFYQSNCKTESGTRNVFLAREILTEAMSIVNHVR